jgi:hypothetical protein
MAQERKLEGWGFEANDAGVQWASSDDGTQKLRAEIQ